MTDKLEQQRKDADDAKAPLFQLDRSTLVPIGLLVSVVLAAVGATTWIQGTLMELQHKIDLLDTRLATLAIVDRDRWMLHDQAAWCELLQARNPALNVPLPRKN